MAKIINMTPHTVNIVAQDGTIMASFPSEGIARASQTAEHVGELDGIELVSMKFGNHCRPSSRCGRPYNRLQEVRPRLKQFDEEYLLRKA